MKIFPRIITVFFLVSFYFCSGQNEFQNNTAKQVLRVGILSFPRLFNPAYITDEVSMVISNKVYDSLFCFNENGEPSSKLLKSYRILKDKEGFVVEIILKDNIFFSNGQQFTFKDIVGTVNLLKDKRFFSPYKPYVSEIKCIEKVDDFHFKIIFRNKNANWKNYLSFKILNYNEISGISFEKFKNKILSGTGPLKFKEINRPSEIILSPNLYYNKSKKSKYSEIIFSIIPYTNNSPIKIINNEIDIISLTYENFLTYNRKKNWQRYFKVYKFKKFAFSYIAFNMKRKNINLQIRKTFYTVLHSGNFIKNFLNERGEQVYTPFYLLNKKIKTANYLLEKPKNRIMLTLLSDNKNIILREFILFLKKKMENHNIFLKPVFLENQLLISKLKKKDFDIAISGFLLDIDYDMKDVLYSKSYFNYTSYSNKAMDDLLDRGLRVLNGKKRKLIYLKANKVWEKDLPIIPLFNLYFYKAVSNKIFIPPKTTKLIGSSGDFLQNIEDWIYKF